MSRAIKGILFDLGDTLLDFGVLDIPSLFQAGARLAYEHLRQLGHSLPAFARYHRQQLWAIRWNYLKSRFTRREFNALDILGRLSTRMGNDLTDEQALELAWLWYEPMSLCASVEEGLREMLAEFRDRGLTLGVVSNTFVPGDVLDRHLRQKGLLDLLPVRVYSCQVRYRKPDPEIFQIALRRAGLRADQTLFVGDSLRTDVGGANRAGMISVLKDPAGRHGRACGADHRIRRLAELRDVLAGYSVAQ